MMLNKVAVFGDIHLGLYKNDEIWLDYSERWIDYFIEECKNNQINTILFLGDWFHYRDSVNVNTLNRGTILIEKLHNNFEKVIMIVGNHDCYLKDTAEIHSLGAYKKWDNITVVDKPKKIQINNKDCMFVPWGADLPQGTYEYLFGHFEIINFYQNKAHKCENGETHTHLLNKAKTIFSGHFHMKQEKEYKKGNIVYVGSPFQHNYGDINNENGFFIIDFSSDEYSFIKNPIGQFPTFHRIDISKVSDIKGIKDDLKNGFVTINVDKEVKDSSLETLKNKLYNTFKIKDLQYDFRESIRVLDNLNISDNIDEIDILSSTIEFVKNLKLKHEKDIIELIKQKVKKYE